jgi:prepilin peptidase CpaA
MLEISSIATSVALIAALIGAVTDVWKFRVYNILTLPLLFFGLLFHGISGGWEGFSMSAMGAMFGLMALIFPYALGLMGAGDVKLLAGVGAWLGVWPTIFVFIFSCFVAGAYALGLIVYRGEFKKSLVAIKLICYRFAAMGTHFGKDDLVEELSVSTERRLRLIPFGAMIPLGIIGMLMWFSWLR